MQWVASILVGLVALLARKRRGLHSRMGLAYLGCMTGVFASALWLATVHPNPFLLGVAIFSYYLTFMGFSSARWKLDLPWAVRWLAPLSGVAGAAVLVWQLHIVAMVFGGILLLNALSDLAIAAGWWKPKSGKLSWMFAHGGKMGGSYISVVTAFLVVNIEFDAAPWLMWLLPTVIGTALLTRWNVRARRRLKAR